MTNSNRIHIFGAAGSGTTTLGRALAERLNIPHFDSDDYFWIDSAVPYTVQRERDLRAPLLQRDLEQHPDWVLSGSLCGWGDSVIPLFTLAVFLWVPQDIRLERLRERELRRFGRKAIAPGGWFHENHLDFIEYASLYDTAGTEVRSRVLHEAWIKQLPCDIVRFEDGLDIGDMVDEIVAFIGTR